MPQQAAEGQEKSNDFRAQHNGRHAAHRFGAHPDDERHAQREAQPRQPRRHVQRHLREGVVQNRTACRDIGVGQNVEHKGNRDAVDDVPALAEQVAGNSVKARTNAVVQVSFEDHQARVQHTEPGEDQRRQRPEEPRPGHHHWQREHPCADNGTADDHHTAKQ